MSQYRGSVRNQRRTQKVRISLNENPVFIKVLIRMLPIRKPLKTKKSSTPSGPSGCTKLTYLRMALPK